MKKETQDNFKKRSHNLLLRFVTKLYTNKIGLKIRFHNNIKRKQKLIIKTSLYKERERKKLCVCVLKNNLISN